MECERSLEPPIRFYRSRKAPYDLSHCGGISPQRVAADVEYANTCAIPKSNIDRGAMVEDVPRILPEQGSGPYC